MAKDDDDEVASSTLAQRLDHLFKTVHPPNRGEFSLEEVATAITAAGTPISAQYLWLLRRGTRLNPTKRHLEGVSKFFGISPAYFFDEEVAERVDAQLGVLAAMRDAQVRSVALRAAGLSPSTLGAIQSIIEGARRLEGLPADPPPAEQGDEGPGAGTA